MSTLEIIFYVKDTQQ